MAVPRRRRVSRLARFRVSLVGIWPEIWRRFEIDAGGTFWDLHVAIQDAFGWQDSHLHVFRVPNRLHRGGLLVGIPFDDGFGGDGCDRGDWDVGLSTVFRKAGDTVAYEYDFGDSWEHKIVLEAIEDAPAGVKLPRCLAGERAAPPEDCGGAPGYRDLLEALRDPEHEQHKELSEWVPPGFDPERFDPARVAFRNARKRLNEMREIYEYW